MLSSFDVEMSVVGAQGLSNGMRMEFSIQNMFLHLTRNNNGKCEMWVSE